MPRTSVLCVLMALLAAVAAAGNTPEIREQLPPGVTPLHYDLNLIPDCENLRFKAQVRITVDVTESAPAIVLNAAELTFDRVTLDHEDKPTSVALDERLQRATLTFGHSVAAGRHKLTINYHGTINKGTSGFFAMDYGTPAGRRRTLITNFEPASERRFMPSWDEPGLKATFSVSVESPAGLMAVGNMPIVSTERLPDGKKRVHFDTTPKMSTYLLFVAIGDFERIATKVGTIDLGVVMNRGDAEKGHYALAEAGRILNYYNGYFGIRYPLPKLDLVAAPGVGQGFSAMENWGAILFAQDALLFDPKLSTEADRQQVFEIVSHEMAHQWFGDLVTMQWWDDLWLNEGFASWMATKIADDLHPEWKAGVQALARAERGKRQDAKQSAHPIVQQIRTPSQAEQAFDNITYEKGAAVIRMLEGYVGQSAFRDGVRRYVSSHAYGNTVDADFWREVQKVSGLPLLQIESEFTRQPGVPLLRVESVEMDDHLTKLVVSQGRFLEDPSMPAPPRPENWHIPVAFDAGGLRSTQLISGSAPAMLAFQGRGPVIVNAGQTAFARTLYPQSAFKQFVAELSALKPADQLGLLHDAWALGQSGYAPVTNYLDLTHALRIDADPTVWKQVIETLVSIDRLYNDKPGQRAFRAFARDRLKPLGDRLGWDPSPGEEQNTAILRDTVLGALSRFDDQSVLDDSRRRFADFMKNPNEISPAIRKTVLSIAARHADTQMLDRLIALLRGTQDALAKQNICLALAGIGDSAGAQRVLDLSVAPDLPAGMFGRMLWILSKDHPNLTWKFSVEHLDRPGFSMDSMLRLFLMPIIASNSSDMERIGDLQTYADAHIPPSARLSVQDAIGTIKLNSKFRQLRVPEIDRWLETNTIN